MTRDGFFDDRGNAASRLIVRYRHPTFGSLEQVGELWNLADTQLAASRAPPELGKHTAEILVGLGFSSSEIAELATTRLIVTSAADRLSAVRSA